jgi:hypothetical protein
MANLRYGTGGLRVTMSDELDQLYRRAIERVAPGVLRRIEDATADVFNAARAEWPVKTGRSRDALEHHVTVSPDQTSVRGSITNPVKYARYIRAKKLDGKSAFVELLRKPLRARAADLAEVLATEAVTGLKAA